MSELAEIFGEYGDEYRAKYEQRMPASHKVAMAAIEQCRTKQLGGHVYSCERAYVKGRGENDKTSGMR